MKAIIKRFLYVSLVVALCLVTVMGGVMTAYADTYDEESIQAQFERTEVLADLQGATIGDNEFNLEDYPHSDTGKPQIISFVEFCYSYYADKQSDYGLYVYVYNPQDLAFDTSTDRNKIQITYGDRTSYYKYPLEFIRYSQTAGYEGRFYKFKLKLTSNERAEILKTVSQNERIYKVSGIELSVSNTVTEYVCAQVYTYSGFAMGYGSELAESDTLTCAVDGLEAYVELNVNHTVYRAKGDYYNGEQSQLNSCFFRLPNKYFRDYGELTEIACEWYEYFTKPILVTEDQYTYTKINALHGKDTDMLSDDVYFLINAFWQNSKTSWFIKSGTSDWTSNYEYKVGDTFSWGLGNRMTIEYDSFPNFAAAFYTGGGACEDYEISGTDLRTKLLENSGYMGKPYIHGVYSAALFEDYVQEGRTFGYNRKEIKADDQLDIFWNYTTKSLWAKIFTGKQDVDTVFESLDAIVTVKDSDLTGNDAEIAGRLKIHESDVAKLKTEQKKAQLNDETVVLFRYSSTKYFCAPSITAYCSKGKIDGGKTLIKATADKFADNNYNAYVCQETVYLDYDIISLTYTRDGVETVIPVVSSPQDVISGLQPPLEEPADNSKNWLAIILGLIVFVIIVILLMKFAPGVFVAIGKAIAWVFVTPFKLIGKLVEKRREGKEQREEKKKQRKAKKARRQMDKQFDDFHKKCDKEKKKILRNYKKVDVETLKNKIWSGEVSRADLTKTERYALEQDEEWIREEEILDQLHRHYDDDDGFWRQ